MARDSLPVAAVPDQELALSLADGNHRVDGLHARLQGLLHGLAVADARRLELHGPGAHRLDRALVVDGDAQRVDHAADQLVADGHLEDPAGPPDLAALVQVQVVAEDDRADAVLFQVQGKAEDAGLELEHLHGHGAAHPVDARDAVAQLHDGPDLVHGEILGVVADLFLDPRGYLFQVDAHDRSLPSPRDCDARVFSWPSMLNSISWPSLSATTPPMSEGRTSVSSSTRADRRVSRERVIRAFSSRPRGKAEETFTFRTPRAKRESRSNSSAISPRSRRAAPVHQEEEEDEEPGVHLPLEARAHEVLLRRPADEPVGQEIAHRPVGEQGIARRAQVLLHGVGGRGLRARARRGRGRSCGRCCWSSRSQLRPAPARREPRPPRASRRTLPRRPGCPRCRSPA